MITKYTAPDGATDMDFVSLRQVVDEGWNNLEPEGQRHLDTDFSGRGDIKKIPAAFRQQDDAVWIIRMLILRFREAVSRYEPYCHGPAAIVNKDLGVWLNAPSLKDGLPYGSRWVRRP